MKAEKQFLAGNSLSEAILSLSTNSPKPMVINFVSSSRMRRNYDFITSQH